MLVIVILRVQEVWGICVYYCFIKVIERFYSLCCGVGKLVRESGEVKFNSLGTRQSHIP